MAPVGNYDLVWGDFGDAQISYLISHFYPDILFLTGAFSVQVRNQGLFLMVIYNHTEQGKSMFQCPGCLDKRRSRGCFGYFFPTIARKQVFLGDHLIGPDPGDTTVGNPPDGMGFQRFLNRFVHLMPLLFRPHLKGLIAEEERCSGKHNVDDPSPY